MVVESPFQPLVVKSGLILWLFELMDVVEVAACKLHVYFFCLAVPAGVPEFDCFVLWSGS